MFKIKVAHILGIPMVVGTAAIDMGMAVLKISNTQTIK